MRYFVGFLITMGLIILLIILIFHGGGKPKVPSTSKTLASYALTDAEVSMTIDGPINAVSQHQQVRVTVDRDNVTFESLKGYDGDVAQLKRYDNTTAAYSAFLSALNNAGFTKGTSSEGTSSVEGVCPLGSRYIFKLTQDNQEIENFWATTCGVKTYGGSLSITTTLFQVQVPDYSTLTQNFETSI